MKKRKKYSRITQYRKASRRKDRNFWIYMAICLLVVLICQIRLPEKQEEYADPGTVKEMSRESVVELEGSEGEYADADVDLNEIPEYTGNIYCEVNGNVPAFAESDKELLSTPGYEYYSALDLLGRCGYGEACVGPETQPEGEERGEIWTVHPSGWRSGQGWERCHLIAWALTGENANDHNLVTGTHRMNVDGMLPFEIEVAEAADAGKHIMYRVTPIYKGSEPICRGVHMMAQTVEDDSVSFNVFVFNAAEEGKTVDYVSGYIR